MLYSISGSFTTTERISEVALFFDRAKKALERRLEIALIIWIIPESPQEAFRATKAQRLTKVARKIRIRVTKRARNVRISQSVEKTVLGFESSRAWGKRTTQTLVSELPNLIRECDKS